MKGRPLAKLAETEALAAAVALPSLPSRCSADETECVRCSFEVDDGWLIQRRKSRVQAMLAAFSLKRASPVLAVFFALHAGPFKRSFSFFPMTLAAAVEGRFPLWMLKWTCLLYKLHRKTTV